MLQVLATFVIRAISLSCYHVMSAVHCCCLLFGIWAVFSSTLIACVCVADMSGSRMMDFMPYVARPRFPPAMHNNFHHAAPDLSSSGPLHHSSVSQATPPTSQVGHDLHRYGLDNERHLFHLLLSLLLWYGKKVQPGSSRFRCCET